METITLETVKNNPNTYYADPHKNLMVYLPEGLDKFGKEGPGIYVAAHGDGDLLLELAVADSFDDHTYPGISVEDIAEHFNNYLANHEFAEADPLLVEEFLEKMGKVVSPQTLKGNSNLVAITSSGEILYYDQQDKTFKFLQSGWYLDSFQTLDLNLENTSFDEDTFISRYLARNGATLAISWDEVYERFGERPEGGVRSVQEVINGWNNTDVYLTSHKKGNLHFAMPREDGNEVIDFLPVAHLMSNRKSALIISVIGKSDKLDEPGEFDDMYMNLHDMMDSEEELTKFIKAADAEFAPYYWVDKKGYPADAPTLLGRSSD